MNTEWEGKRITDAIISENGWYYGETITPTEEDEKRCKGWTWERVDMTTDEKRAEQQEKEAEEKRLKAIAYKLIAQRTYQNTENLTGRILMRLNKRRRYIEYRELFCLKVKECSVARLAEIYVILREFNQHNDDNFYELYNWFKKTADGAHTEFRMV